jgi:glycosyltransferase involved in cell wall biosynthesis
MSVGVVMPCRSPLELVRGSVQSVLRQTYADFHMVIVDDASPAPVREYLDSLTDARVRVVRHETPQGVAASANHGLREVEADLVFRMDADDVASPRRFERQIARFKAEPGLTVLGANMVKFHPDRPADRVTRKVPTRHEAIAYRMFWSNAINQPTVAFRKAAVTEMGGYEERLAPADDYDLWTRMIVRYRFANLSERLLDYRLHDDQLSERQSEKMKAGRAEIRDRYRRQLTGIAVPPIFDDLPGWSEERHPSAREWDAWLDFLEGVRDLFRSGKVGQLDVRPFDPGLRLARRLHRSVTTAHRLGLKEPPRARRLLRRLAPFYALIKGTF